MKRISVLLVAGAATLFLSGAGPRHTSTSKIEETHRRAEVARLRAHFDSVDTELRSRDVSQLSLQQRANRAKLIAWLREYRDAAEFPRNDRFAERSVPIFRDSRGTLCAMAYLVNRSGASDIVDRIARTRNYAFIRELTDDRRLVSWLDLWGLTAAEAGRIQPQYGPSPILVPDRSRVSSNYALLSMGVGGASVGTLGFNLFSPSYTSGAAGITAGLATIMAGAVHIKDGGGDETVAKVNAAVGSAALLAGVRALLAARNSHTSSPGRSAAGDGASYQGIAPDLGVSTAGAYLGFRVATRF